ncbi:MAG: hypothetical protein FWG88_00510 [Oscillospiraceae bacterium]|nr:hypothetical protein [Oscillospiraceae bacterium]
MTYSDFLSSEIAEETNVNSHLYRINIEANVVEKLDRYIQNNIPEGYQGVVSIGFYGEARDSFIWLIESIDLYDITGLYTDTVRQLRIIDETGKVYTSINMAELLGFNPHNAYLARTDSNGNLGIFANGKLHVIDTQLKIIHEQAFEEQIIQLIKVGNGNIGLITQNSFGNLDLILFDTQFGSRNNVIHSMPSNVSIYDGNNDYDVLYYINGMLYSYNLNEMSSSIIHNLFLSNIYDTPVDVLFLLNDSFLITVLEQENDNTFTMKKLHLVRIPVSEMNERITLTLAVCAGTGIPLDTAIKNFNSIPGNPYYIEVIPYEYFENNTDYLDEFTINMAAGFIPDMIATNYFPIHLYVQNGYIEDLYKFLDNDVELNRSSFHDNVIKSFEINGIFAHGSLSFSIISLIGAKSKIESISKWSLEAMSTVIKDNGIYGFAGINKIDLLYIALCYNMPQFISRDSAQCSFDSNEFKSLLAFVNDCQMLEGDSLTYDEIREVYETGDTLLYSTFNKYGSSFLGFLYIIPAKELFRDEVLFIGFPNDTGLVAFIEARDGVAMTTSCKDKDGAWQFIRSLLTADGQDSSRNFRNVSSLSRFPTNIDSMNRLINYYMDLDNEDGITKNDVTMIIDVINNAQALSMDPNIVDIICETAAAYFMGTREIDETANIIQNRVTLYLSELYGW